MGRPPTRLTFLDAMRGFAAMWVVLYHVAAADQARQARAALPAFLRAALFDAGHFGVPVFFVLSGFVIARAIGTDRVDARYVGRFALRRAVRLDPPYWAAIALTLVFVMLKHQITGDPTLTHQSPGAVLAHMFYAQEFLGIRELNPVFWTLSYEVQFYLLFCTLLAVAHVGGRPRLLAPFGVAAVAAVVWPLVRALYVRGLALPGWHGFLLGAFAAWVIAGRLKLTWFALFALLLVGVWTLTGDSFTVVCLATASVILLVDRADGLATWLSARPLQFLGRISYSLYLLHVPISGAAFYAMRRMLPASTLAEFVSILVVLAVNVAAAHLLWWTVERPSTTLARRVRTR